MGTFIIWETPGLFIRYFFERLKITKEEKTNEKKKQIGKII